MVKCCEKPTHKYMLSSLHNITIGYSFTLTNYNNTYEANLYIMMWYVVICSQIT